eukprot:4137867-Prymnesium_polylepis.1
MCKYILLVPVGGQPYLECKYRRAALTEHCPASVHLHCMYCGTGPPRCWSFIAQTARRSSLARLSISHRPPSRGTLVHSQQAVRSRPTGRRNRPTGQPFT